MSNFPDGVFIGKYKGVKLYAHKSEIKFLFGWAPQTASSIRAAKNRITRWLKGA